MTLFIQFRNGSMMFMKTAFENARALSFCLCWQILFWLNGKVYVFRSLGFRKKKQLKSFCTRFSIRSPNAVERKSFNNRSKEDGTGLPFFLLHNFFLDFHLLRNVIMKLYFFYKIATFFCRFTFIKCTNTHIFIKLMNFLLHT